MEFGKLLGSAFNCVKSWVKSKTELLKEENYFIDYWDNLLCTCGSAHSFLGLNLAAGLWVDMFVYKYWLQFNICFSDCISFWLALLTHLAGTHFSALCLHWSGQVRLRSSSSWSRLSDMDSGKSAFMSWVLRPAFFEPQEAVP